MMENHFIGIGDCAKEGVRVSKGDRFEISEDMIKGKIGIGKYVYVMYNNQYFHTKGSEELRYGVVTEIYGYWETAKLRFQRLRISNSLMKSSWISLKNLFNRQCIVMCVK